MPVQLSRIDGAGGQSALPASPRLPVWVGLLLICMLAGTAATLLLWPKNTSTATPIFWICVLAHPFLVWCALFGIRRMMYERSLLHRQTEVEMQKSEREAAIHFASEPLAVVASSYCCAVANGTLASSILSGAAILKTQPVRQQATQLRHSALDLELGAREDLPAALRHADDSALRYHALFKKLIHPLRTVILELPAGTAFDVRLQLPAGEPQKVLLSLWKQAWDAAALPAVSVSLLAEDEGLMLVDQWLDAYGGPQLQKLSLVVATQLHAAPEEGSGEAGVALLLGWPLLARELGLPLEAMLHRPVDAHGIALQAAMSKALLWGKAMPADIAQLWQSAVSGDEKAELSRAAIDNGLAAAQRQGLSGLAEIDPVLGMLGVARPWLCTAIAIEHAISSKHTQLVCCRGTRLQMAIVQPLATDREMNIT
jgi:hypothetical protein